jgi:hypothetical protein
VKVKVKENIRLCDVEFSPVKVYKVLRSLKPECSYGPDGLPSILLHNLAGVLSEPLSFIFYSSYHTGAGLPPVLEILGKKFCPGMSWNFESVQEFEHF